jgi:predicted ATPase
VAAPAALGAPFATLSTARAGCAAFRRSNPLILAAVRIHTPDDRLRVFVSSTLGELGGERAVVRGAIERLRLIPVMFETGARPHPPRALYRAYLRQSDVFVGVYWERYGWVAPGEPVSGLEDEYRLAAGRLPQLVYIKEPAPRREAAMVEFLRRIQEDDRLAYRRFGSQEELDRLVSDDLAVLLSERFRASGDQAARAPTRASREPAPLDRTFGREEDVETVAGLVRSGHRLVTLTGPGGVGKTRLAVELGSALAGDFGGSVVFVPLAPVADAALVLATIAERLGLRAGGPGGLEDRIVESLSGRPTLLLLDNLEHLAAAAPEIAAVLDRCPGTAAIVTSRHVLRVHGEREYQVPPLAEAAAVELFTERAAAARPGFHVTPDTEPVVAEIARRLDGLPLAIELAAASMRVYSAAALLDRLCRRLDLPSHGPADAPERQRTLRAAIDWSYDLLEPAERRAFARLAVFDGSFGLSAAEAVCGRREDGPLVETLGRLVEKSLVVPVDVAGSHEPRLRMLATIRAYALERLSELPDRADTERLHTEWVVRLLTDAAPAGQRRYGPAWLERLDLERPNLRTAIERALRDGELETVARITRGSIGYLALRDSEIEGARWLDRALALAGDADPLLRARLLLYQAVLIWGVGDTSRAASLHAEARATSLAVADYPYDRALDATVVAMAASAAQPPGQALPAAIRAAQAWSASGASDLGEAYMWLTAGLLALSFDPAGAERHLGEALRLAEAMANDGLRAPCLTVLGFIARRDGRYDAARERFMQAAVVSRSGGLLSGEAFALDGLAALALDAGRAAVAARALGAADAARRRSDRAAWPHYQPILDELHAAAAGALGGEAYEAALAEGSRRDIADTLDAALEAVPAPPAPSGQAT